MPTTDHLQRARQTRISDNGELELAPTPPAERTHAPQERLFNAEPTIAGQLNMEVQ